MCKNVFLSQLKTVNNKIRQLCSANIIRYRRIFCQSKSERHAQKNGKNEFEHVYLIDKNVFRT